MNVPNNFLIVKRFLGKYKKKKSLLSNIVPPKMTGIAVLAFDAPFGLEALNK